MNKNNSLNSIDTKYKLKYYYLIDIDNLIKDIRSRIDNQKNMTDFNIFHCVFRAIYDSTDCRRYFAFLTSKESFNVSISPESEYSSGCAYIFETIFENHCILYGYHNALRQNPGSEIRISASTEKLFEQDEYTLAQNYNKYKHRFQKFSENYSYQYLKKHYSFSETTGFPVAFEYNEPVVRFLFTQSIIRTFDANIEKPYLLKHYQSLFNNIDAFKTSLKNAPFTFDYSMEYLYGFSFFRPTFKLLNYIYGKGTYKKHPILYQDNFRIKLENLSGDPTLDLISQVASLPMVYNRYFFLQYILYNIVSSEKLEHDILLPNKYALFEHLPDTPASNFYLIEDGLFRAGEYIQRIHYLVLPLLEDLWSVITHELPEINLQTYEEYIHTNSGILSFDFSSYEMHDFKEIRTFSLEQNKKTFYAKLREKISNVSLETDTLSGSLDSFSKPHAVQLLKKYLTCSRIDNTPKDTAEQLFKSGSRGTAGKFKIQHINALSDFSKRVL